MTQCQRVIIATERSEGSTNRRCLIPHADGFVNETGASRFLFVQDVSSVHQEISFHRLPNLLPIQFEVVVVRDHPPPTPPPPPPPATTFPKSPRYSSTYGS